MMITSSRGADFTTEQGVSAVSTEKICKAATATQWSRLKDPRIVRASRAFGGKDRHSKVCTVRGLRDRRVRLSVSTAIQLYDLQDRLGLNQPSKVVDWLLNAAKHEIDELPPLQIPPENINSQSHEQLMLASSGARARYPNQQVPNYKLDKSINWDDPLGGEGEEEEEEERQSGVEGHDSFVSFNNFFPRHNQSSLPGLINSFMPYNSFYRLDPSNYSLSHFGSHGLAHQTEDHQHNPSP